MIRPRPPLAALLVIFGLLSAETKAFAEPCAELFRAPELAAEIEEIWPEELRIESFGPKSEGVSVVRFQHDPTYREGTGTLLMNQGGVGGSGASLSAFAVSNLFPAEQSRVATADQFSLGYMDKRGVLNGGQSSFYGGETNKLDHRQVTLIDYVTFHLPARAERLARALTERFGMKPGSFISGFFRLTLRGVSEVLRKVRSASLRLLSGTVPIYDADGRFIGVERLPVPWQREFRDFKPGIFEDPRVTLWELGRAASVSSSRGFQLCLATAVLTALRELQATGGDIRHAYLTVHATNARNVELFSAKGRGYEFIPLEAKPVEGTEDTILYLPLIDAIERFKPEQYFDSLKLSGKAVGGSVPDAVAFWDRIEKRRHTGATLLVPGGGDRRFKLDLRDLSRFADHDADGAIGAFASPEERARILELSKARLFRESASGRSEYYLERPGIKVSEAGRELAPLEEILVTGAEEIIEQVAPPWRGRAMRAFLGGAVRAYLSRNGMERAPKQDVRAFLSRVGFVFHSKDVEKLADAFLSAGVSSQFDPRDGILGLGLVFGEDLMSLLEAESDVSLKLIDDRVSVIFDSPLNY